MDFDAQKFFIALIDFFSVLLPGAMLAYLIKDTIAHQIGFDHGYPLATAEAQTVFLFASYLLGHLVFLVSAQLDELVYDRFRKCTKWGQINSRLAQGEPLVPAWLRKLASSDFVFGKSADNAVVQVLRLKSRAFASDEADQAINAYQWSKATLTEKMPAAFNAVQRLEADSKFFRSFTVVLILLAGFYAIGSIRGDQHVLCAIVCLLGTVPALWRYIDQRFKGTQHAYWFVLTNPEFSGFLRGSVARTDKLTHAGGIVIKGKGTATKVLLVQASENRNEWVLPKGHIEAGEDPRVTAVREVIEETGIWASIDRWVEDKSLRQGEPESRVRWYIMKSTVEAEACPPEERQHRWLSFDKAEEDATFPETKSLLSLVRKQLGLPR
jgi:8-oxo-dGTP pyrophosphatase MutT (NUDIX family)